jgi:hypothetical protein
MLLSDRRGCESRLIEPFLSKLVEPDFRLDILSLQACELLLLAVRPGNIAIRRELITRYPSTLKVRVRRPWNSALMIAILTLRLEPVKILLELGAGWICASKRLRQRIR